MKILLINPSQKAAYGTVAAPSFPPIGLGYLAAVLRKNGHNVQIIDVDAENLNDDTMYDSIRKVSPDIVGITSTTPTFHQALEMAKLAKQAGSAKTVLGGVHVTIDPLNSFSHDVDFIIKGEGECTFMELANAIESGNRDLSKIKGLLYKNADGKITQNADRELIDNLDSIPFPAWDLFNRNIYSYPDTLRTPVLPIITSRGCPGKCTYCCTKLIFGRRFRSRSPGNIADEIEWLVSEYGIKEVHIWDDNFTTNKKRVLEFCDEIKQRNFDISFAFPNGMRADYLNEEILSALKGIGVYSIALGVESGNAEVLKNIKKGIDLEQVKNIVKISKKLNLETWCFFMFGLPGDNRKTIRETIDFAKALDPDIAKFHILKPFPGTEVYDQLRDSGLIISTNYDDFGIHTRPVHRLPELESAELVEFQKQAYREFYLRPSKLFKQIYRLKSVNRIKTNVSAGISILKTMF